MTPEGAVRLLDLYARMQAELDEGRTAAATVLSAEADALLAEPPPAGSPPELLRALAVQVEDARAAAEAALNTARERLLRAAQAELRPGGGAAEAYAGSHERPGARFIDRTG